MATKKTAAKKAATKPAAMPPIPEGGSVTILHSDPAVDLGLKPATEGASLLATGGDFTPPPPTPAEMEPSKVLIVKRDNEFRASAPPEIEAIAKVCHEANRALCVAMGDNSQKPWAEAADWQRDSAIKGVQFAIDSPEADPAAQHNAWCRDKIAAGWAYGPVKDEGQRTHPCLVDYSYLPVLQQAKDHVFRAIVRAMAGL